MAQVGEKRPPEQQIPDDSEGDASKGGGGGPSSNSPSGTSPAAKRPALPSSNFMFRPSPLQQATQGFTLRQPTLKSTASTFGSNKSPSSTKPPTPMQGGFLKLSSDGLKPIAIHSPPGPLMGGAMGGMTTPTTSQNSSPGDGAVINNDSKRDNPFLQFVANASTSGHSFSSLSSTGPANSSFSQPRSLEQHQASTAAVITSSLSEEDVTSQTSPLDATNQSGESIGNSSFGEEPGTSAGGSGSGVAAPLTIGQQKATAILPEVHPVTGEEGEKKIVQVPARLYAFDLDTHTWKERGRGEIRLNDAAQSEGLFQSRLVMRASGSYRLLLNTHLWAQMKCDRANQKSIRITAQTGTDEKISVFLIMGAGKDIQQLFTAIDRRIEALKRNASTSQEGGEEGTKLTTPKSSSQNASFDEEDKESILDHQSSPESSPEPPDSSTRTRLIPVPILTTSPSPAATQATPTITMVTTTTPTSGNPVITSQITTTSPPTRTSEGHLYRHEEDRSGRGAMAIEPRSQEALLLRRSSSASDKDSESTPNPPSSERSPSCEASTTTTISSSDNALESS